MKEIHHPDWEHSIKIGDGVCTVLTIENPKTYRFYVKEFCAQCNGQDGMFVLSDKAKQFDLSKSCAFVPFPLSLEIQDKKVTTKVTNLLKDCVLSEDLIQSTSKIQSELLRYAEEVRDSFPLCVDYEEPDPVSILKLFSFHLEEEFDSDLEKVLEYMNTYHDVLGIEAFAFVSLRDFFSDEELTLLVEACLAQKHSMILFEGHDKGHGIHQANYIVIDTDNCEVFS